MYFYHSNIVKYQSIFIIQIFHLSNSLLKIQYLFFNSPNTTVIILLKIFNIQWDHVTPLIWGHHYEELCRRVLIHDSRNCSSALLIEWPRPGYACMIIDNEFIQIGRCHMKSNIISGECSRIYIYTLNSQVTPACSRKGGPACPASKSTVLSSIPWDHKIGVCKRFRPHTHV